MTGRLADTGAKYILESVFVQADQALETEITLHLYTNDYTPTDETEESDVTEATGGGYSAQTIDVEKSFIDSVAITSNSVASPTQILCGASHGLTSNDYVTIRNNSGSVPQINGTHQVTVVDSDEFTIPVNVTTGGTGGVVSRGFQSSSSGGIRQIQCNPIPFHFTGALTGSVPIYGCFIKTASGGDFVGAIRFGTTYTPTTSGDLIELTPTIKLSYGTAA